MRDDTSDSRASKSVDPDTARSRQQLIGRRLKDMYHSVLDEGIPDDFEQLLNALDSSEEPAQAPGKKADGPDEEFSDG